METILSSKESAVIAGYIDENASSVIIQRGNNVIKKNLVQLVALDPAQFTASFKVKSEGLKGVYKVKIQNYNNPELISSHCTCPYDYGMMCKHEVATLLFLQNLLDKKQEELKKVMPGDSPSPYFEPIEKELPIGEIKSDFLTKLAGREMVKDGVTIASSPDSIVVTEAAKGLVRAEVTDKDRTYSVTIRKNEKQTFSASCNCWKNNLLLCEHRYALFFFLLKKYDKI